MTEPTLPNVDVAVRTDPGRDPDKQVNEDTSAHAETALGLLAVVCDGMGGHAGGKEASELAVRTILEIVEAAPARTSPEAALRRAIEEANARVWSMPTAEAGFRPGSTVVAALVHEGGAEVAHVGDSRLYLMHAGAISQVTRDHSMVEEMVARKLIRAEDAATHPDANKILRALGIAKTVEVDVRAEPIAYVAGDVLVLCSDGLSDLVEPAEILEIAGSAPPAQAAGKLVDLANARGGHDNITAMVVRMKASAKPREGDRGGDRRAVPKTIPLTAHAPAPEGAPGPTGTLVSAPVTPTSAPAKRAPEPLAPPARIPPAAPVRAGGERSRSRAPTVVLGVALAVIAVTILAAVVFLTSKRQHKVVPFIVDEQREAAAPEPEEEAGAVEEAVTPAPTLTVEPPPRQVWRLPDGGAPDPCSAARRLRERGDASPALLQRLDKRCKAKGETP